MKPAGALLALTVLFAITLVAWVAAAVFDTTLCSFDVAELRGFFVFVKRNVQII